MPKPSMLHKVRRSAPVTKDHDTMYRDQDARAAIKRAEAAVEALSPSFQSWLAEEVAALVSACNTAAAAHYAAESRQAIFLSAHTLKGQGATLGYPQISQVAASLCRLLDGWTADQAFCALAWEHVDAICKMAEREPHAVQQPADLERVQQLNAKTIALIGEPSDWD